MYWNEMDRSFNRFGGGQLGWMGEPQDFRQADYGLGTVGNPYTGGQVSQANFSGLPQGLPTGAGQQQQNPYQIGYEQASPVAMQPPQAPSSPLAKLMTGYQGPQRKSMWQGYRPQAAQSFRFGG